MNDFLPVVSTPPPRVNENVRPAERGARETGGTSFKQVLEAKQKKPIDLETEQAASGAVTPPPNCPVNMNETPPPVDPNTDPCAEAAAPPAGDPTETGPTAEPPIEALPDPTLLSGIAPLSPTLVQEVPASGETLEEMAVSRTFVQQEQPAASELSQPIVTEGKNPVAAAPEQPVPQQDFTEVLNIAQSEEAPVETVMPAAVKADVPDLKASAASQTPIESQTSETAPKVTVERAESAAAETSPDGSTTQLDARVDSAALSGSQKASDASPLPRDPVRMAEVPAREMLQQVARNIELGVHQGRTSLRLQLNPLELGAIDVRLVSGPHGLGVTVFADQASTGRLLEKQLDQLRQTLTDAGVNLTHLNVSQHNQQSSSQPQGFAPGYRRQEGRSSFSGNERGREMVEEPQPTRSLGPSLIDYRV